MERPLHLAASVLSFPHHTSPYTLRALPRLGHVAKTKHGKGHRSACSQMSCFAGRSATCAPLDSMKGLPQYPLLCFQVLGVERNASSIMLPRKSAEQSVVCCPLCAACPAVAAQHSSRLTFTTFMPGRSTSLLLTGDVR